MNSAIIGIIAAIAITVMAIRITTSNYMAYWNLLGLMIVIGGTFSAAAIAYGVGDIFRLIMTFLRVFTRPKETPLDAVQQILKVAKLTASGTPLTNKALASENLHPFLLDGIRLIENDIEAKRIEEIMTSSAIERKNLFSKDIETLSTLAKYPPAFGMIGTVLGLVALLNGLGSKDSAASIGPNMSVALLTTLYGLLVANYFFIPMTDNLTVRLKMDMAFRKVIIKGMLLLQDGEDIFLIKEILAAHVTPAHRKMIDKSFSDASNIGKAA
jgi:chemotaxis protein MotA